MDLILFIIIILVIVISFAMIVRYLKTDILYAISWIGIFIVYLLGLYLDVCNIFKINGLNSKYSGLFFFGSFIILLISSVVLLLDEEIAQLKF